MLPDLFTESIGLLEDGHFADVRATGFASAVHRIASQFAARRGQKTHGIGREYAASFLSKI